MDSPRLFLGIIVPTGVLWCGVSAINQGESKTNATAATKLGATVVGVDLAKSVFQTAVAAVQARSNHNKAACALANKMARICYATLHDGEPYGAAMRLNKKLDRTAFAMPG